MEELDNIAKAIQEEIKAREKYIDYLNQLYGSTIQQIRPLLQHRDPYSVEGSRIVQVINTTHKEMCDQLQELKDTHKNNDKRLMEAIAFLFEGLSQEEVQQGMLSIPSQFHPLVEEFLLKIKQQEAQLRAQQEQVQPSSSQSMAERVLAREKSQTSFGRE